MMHSEKRLRTITQSMYLFVCAFHSKVSSSSSSSSAAADNSPEMIVKVSTLKRMQDSIERAAAAASHAVKISTQARNAFEEEQRRLSESAQEMAMLCKRAGRPQ